VNDARFVAIASSLSVVQPAPGGARLEPTGTLSGEARAADRVVEHGKIHDES
jgi:hypothetical protein